MPRYESHWREFDSPLIRNEIWAAASSLWPRLFHLPFVRMGIISRRNTIEYFFDMDALGRAQKILLQRIQEKPSFLRTLIAQANRWGASMNRFTARVAHIRLERLSTQQLQGMHKRFAEMQTREYAVGILVAILDVSFGDWSIDRITKGILKGKFSDPDVNRFYNILTVPTRKSFARQGEEELLLLYTRIRRSPRLIRILRVKPAPQVFKEFERHAPGIAGALVRHTKKWAWTYYVYAGPAWDEHDFIKVIQNWAQRGVIPAQLRQQWRMRTEKVKKEQQQLLTSLLCSKKEKALLRLLALVVWAKPHRKDYQSMSYWHMERFFLEVGRRIGISLSEARSLPTSIMWAALHKGRIDDANVKSLFQLHMAINNGLGVRILTRRAAERMMRTVSRDSHRVHGMRFRGSPAHSGKAVGIACLINSPADLEKMQEGNILVSVATTPSIITAMRKAAAIVTDEGGLTCHAAIVSRELRIPCIVGLRIITRAVKDGDQIEVDATNGIVRILSN